MTSTDASRLPSSVFAVGAAGLLLMTSAGCTSSSTTEVTPPAPTSASLNEASVIELKKVTADTAKDVFSQLSTAGPMMHSASGMWTECADGDPSFGQYNVTGLATFPPGEPASQMDPLVKAMESDGWTVEAQTVDNEAVVTDLSNIDAALKLTTSGSSLLRMDLIGSCIQSELIGTDGYRINVDLTSIDTA